MLGKLREKFKKQEDRWIHIHSREDLEEAWDRSHEKPVALLKHSTRCATSSMAKGRLEREADKLTPHADLFLLDVVRHRDLAREIAKTTGIEHESPQLLILKEGAVISNCSHNQISHDVAIEALEQATS